MTPFLVAALMFAAADAQPSPEECIAKPAVVVAFAGKTYRLASEACRAQFLADPERYSQLYDALLELQASGASIAPAPASAVPS